MTLTIGHMTHGSAVNLMLKNPILAEHAPCLELDTGIIKIGDGSSSWEDLLTLRDIYLSNDASVPAFPPPYIDSAIFLMHDTITITVHLGEPVLAADRVGCEVFVYSQVGELVSSRRVANVSNDQVITITRADTGIASGDFGLVGLHVRTYGTAGTAGSGYGTPSNSVLIVVAPSAITGYAHVRKCAVSYGDGITITPSDVVSTDDTSDVSITCIVRDDTSAIVSTVAGTLDLGVDLPPMSVGDYTYVLTCICSGVTVSTYAGTLNVPSPTTPMLQSYRHGETTLSIMGEYPISPYPGDRITTVTAIVTVDGVTTRTSVGLHPSYIITVTAGDITTLALEYAFAIYPGTFITNSTDITASASEASETLSDPSGTFVLPTDWDDGDGTCLVDIVGIGCGGDGAASTSEFIFGTSGDGGCRAWATKVKLTQGVSYPYTVGARDIVSGGNTTFADLFVAGRGKHGVAGGARVSPSTGGTYSVNASSALLTAESTYGGAIGGLGGGDGLRAGGGGGAAGMTSIGGNGGTMYRSFYTTSESGGGAGGKAQQGGGGSTTERSFSGNYAGAGAIGAKDGAEYIAQQQRPDGGSYGGGGAGSNSLYSPGHGAAGTLRISRSS